MSGGPDGVVVGGGPVTGTTEDMSIFTGLWFAGKLVIPGRLKAARASTKFSEIKTRYEGLLTLSIGGSAARGLRFPFIKQWSSQNKYLQMRPSMLLLIPITIPHHNLLKISLKCSSTIKTQNI